MKNTTCSRLKKFRKMNNMTQVELAEIIGVHVNTYQLYETNKLDFPVRHAKKLVKFYKIDWWTLYEE